MGEEQAIRPWRVCVQLYRDTYIASEHLQPCEELL